MSRKIGLEGFQSVMRIYLHVPQECRYGIHDKINPFFAKDFNELKGIFLIKISALLRIVLLSPELTSYPPDIGIIMPSASKC